jgi:hypothetical protein
LLVDADGSGDAGNAGGEGSPGADTSESGGSHPDPSDPDEGPSVQYDVAAPGSDGAVDFDAGGSDGVCTEYACFGPAQNIDPTAAYAIAVVDLDGDGTSEIVAGTDDGLQFYELRGGVPVAVQSIATVGRVIAIAAGRLDGDVGGDVVALTDAGRVVVVPGGSAEPVTSLVVSDGQLDVALAPIIGATPSFVTASREGTVTLWRRIAGAWAPTFFATDASPSVVAVGATQGSSTLVVSAGDEIHGRIDVLAIDGDQLLASASYLHRSGDPLQLEAGAIAAPGVLPELLVLTDDPGGLQIDRFAEGVDSLYGRQQLALSGSPRGFAQGWLGSGGRDLAVVDDVAGTLEICTLAIGDEYVPLCSGVVIEVGPEPIAVAIGALDDSEPEDIAIASPSAGVTVVLGALTK